MTVILNLLVVKLTMTDYIYQHTHLCYMQCTDCPAGTYITQECAGSAKDQTSRDRKCAQVIVCIFCCSVNFYMSSLRL